jgi:hypothetical protein
MALVSLSNAKAHLNVQMDSHDDDMDVQQKADQATALVLERCNGTAYWREITPDWTIETVPAPVQAAVLTMLGHLWRNRGDSKDDTSQAYREVDRQLSGHKDPIIA